MDLPRVVKTMNEVVVFLLLLVCFEAFKLLYVVWQVWRRYEMKHKPAFILDFRLPQHFIDVNLTPDKREVAMMHESSILDSLREYVDQVSIEVCFNCMSILY